MSRIKFGDFAINLTEKKKPTPDEQLLYIGLEHLDSNCLHVTRWGSEVPIKGEKLVMHKGDILLGKRNAYLRRAAIAPHDGVFSAHGMVLRPKEGIIDSNFFPIFIGSDYFFDAAIKISVGSLSPTINWKDLKELEFNIPDLPEQKKIATLFWALDRTKEGYKRLLTITDELVKSRFIEMFGDPINNSMNWDTEFLCNLGDLNRGVSKHRPRNDPKLLGGIYPLIQTGDVANADGYISCYKSTYSEEGLKQSKMWPAGILCITIAANIAKTAILTFDACFPDSVVGFKAGSKVTNLYIHYWFTFIQKILEEQAPESAQKNINMKILSELNVMVPPIELQNQFADFVAQVDKSKFELRKRLYFLKIRDNQNVIIK